MEEKTMVRSTFRVFLQGHIENGIFRQKRDFFFAI